MAQYNSKCSYTRGSYRLWQCSASGKVDGIVGNVDLDLEFDGAFASNPVRKTWVKVGSNWYLRDSGGNNLIGWQVVDGQRYYLAASGVMQTGWVSYEGVLVLPEWLGRHENRLGPKRRKMVLPRSVVGEDAHGLADG